MHYHYFTIEQRKALEEVIMSRLGEPGMKAALERLHSPAFGVCEACGTDISFIRLQGNPALKRCAACESPG